MASSGFFRGTSLGQDFRFKNKQKKRLANMDCSKLLKKKVDTKKVELAVIFKWISQKITEILGFTDEVVIGLIQNTLEESRFPKGKQMQDTLTGFLEKDAKAFMAELWELLLSAQDEETGIPTKFLEARIKQEEAAKLAAAKVSKNILDRDSESKQKKKTHWGATKQEMQASINRSTDTPADKQEDQKNPKTEDKTRERHRKNRDRSERSRSRSRRRSPRGYRRRRSRSPYRRRRRSPPRRRRRRSRSRSRSYRRSRSRSYRRSRSRSRSRSYRRSSSRSPSSNHRSRRNRKPVARTESNENKKDNQDKNEDNRKVTEEKLSSQTPKHSDGPGASVTNVEERISDEAKTVETDATAKQEKYDSIKTKSKKERKEKKKKSKKEKKAKKDKKHKKDKKQKKSDKANGKEYGGGLESLVGKDMLEEGLRLRALASMKAQT